MSARKAEGRKAKPDRSEILRLGADLLFPTQTSGHTGPTLLAQRDLIVEAAARLLEARAALWLADELFLLTFPAADLALPAEEAPRAPVAANQPGSRLMRCAFNHQRPCYAGADDPQVLPGESTRRWAEVQPRSVALPLLAEDPETHLPAVLGVLQADRSPEAPPFSAADLDNLNGIAVQAALALHSARQMAVERWRLQQLFLVRQVSAQIATARDLDELTRQVTHLILSTFNYYYVAIFTVEPNESILKFRNSAGPRSISAASSEEERQANPGLGIRLGQGLVGWVAEHGEEIVANDVSQEPRYRFSDALPETRAEVGLPLMVGGRVLGVLDVQSNQVNDFHETDMLVLRALAGSIASAVEGARLYTILHRRAEQIQAIYEISNAISSILNEEDLLKQVVELIHRHFGYPNIHIFSVHTGRRKIFYEAGSGPRSEIYKEQGYTLELDDPLGIIPWVGRHAELVVANNVDQEPRYRPSTLLADDTRSELVAPLVFAGVILGVLDVQSEQENAFGEEERFLFEALADTIAVAMRNAALLRSEVWRRQVAESMREVAGLLSADVAIDQVLEAILNQLYRTLPCDIAAIWLLDEETHAAPDQEGDQPEGAVPPPLRLAAVNGADLSSLGLEVGLSLDELMFVFTEPAPEVMDINTGWLREVLQADQPLIRSSKSSFEPLGFALDFPEDYSAIAAPLRAADQLLGVIVLAHRTSGRYGQEARSMIATFASYAAVAIENTRLYEAAHEQAWVSTVLLQVGEATQALTNLSELLATVVRITPMLVGVQACALYMLDEDGVFIPAAAFGFSHEQQLQFERWRFAPGDMPAFDRLSSEKQPLLMQGAEGDLILSAILNSGEDSAAASGEYLVLVPLLARSELIGAMLVDYSAEVNNGLGTVEELFDERLAIIQGIAHQTATAVENIRLQKSRQEEAYVSVALLQVAQAVVSSNDLQATLGSIVRITPILVGVKRSLIFLWDANYSTYELVEAYGVPHQVKGEIYAPSEFPLLEAVRTWNTLMAYPLDDFYEEVPEAWTSLPVPDLDEVDDYLRSEDSLLLAFPLSVKGKVLGVLLVEEPDQAPSDLFSGSGMRRLREKRLEITTGISQQAALAIQNDLLQREVIENERLEREFQLARGIQRTFLPHELPELPGWDLNVRWRTAREVGGDFYDYFELPGNRFGLVIADVADKGMPAALFMTLVRTLVRATVAHEVSPGTVLERVNEVLLPDAQQGMFVTVFYAVLDLESGELQYANAGHNPPLLMHTASGEVELLERSGMALGVMEGLHIEEHRVKMDRGDYLVLYTDGLTEAFSPDGRMYEIDGLMQTILTAREAALSRAPEAGAAAPAEEHAGLSTAELLNGIEADLLAFTGDQPRQDDLTLLALRRLKGA